MQNYLPFVSVVIICEGWNHFLAESLPFYSCLDYSKYEVLVFTTDQVVFPDGQSALDYPNIKFISEPSTKNKPAEKRDLAIKYAKGEIFAFIDDDAFPHKDWLKNAVPYFKDESIAAVGGPGVTPENASNFEKASGWITASPFGGSGVSLRFIPEKKREIDDYPSMNLIVRADDFKKINGFDSNYYPGEDTKLCLDLTKKLNKKIIYDPKILVYHHKRPLFKKHLLQNGRFGLHRGHFARVLPETSRRLIYFIPSLFVIGNILGILVTLLNLKYLSNLYFLILEIYILFLVLNSIWIFAKSKNIIVSFLSIPGVAATHMWYGIKFLQGLLFVRSEKLEDNYGRTE
jgi:cellulose synthase/poly-beta-1,6-N-acetylglucosamine synthase-like glycosyltransferase